jgi:hypothetical protein
VSLVWVVLLTLAKVGVGSWLDKEKSDLALKLVKRCFFDDFKLQEEGLSYT